MAAAERAAQIMAERAGRNRAQQTRVAEVGMRVTQAEHDEKLYGADEIADRAFKASPVHEPEAGE